VAVVALAAGCEGADLGPGNRQGPGGRHQTLGLSPEQELAVGRRAYREVLNDYRGQILSPDSPEAVRVRRITERLARAAAIEPLQREINLRVRGYRFEWEVNVVRDRQANAFCLPAGKIVVFTGIIRVAGGDDHELATVLAHEMAHALAHHGSERVARQRTGEGVLRSLRYDRQQESEADHIGVFLMPFAGYHPDQAAEFWERMVDRGGGMPEFLSDHPSPETRVRDLRVWARQARAAKAAYDRGDVVPAR
jgi:predicted Zn-dependent protease